MVGTQSSSASKRFFEFKWDARADPVLFVNVGKKRLGLALFCHRKPERSFNIHGRACPLCARCTGLLFGFFGALGLAFLHMQIPLLATLIMMTPMAIDGLSQLAGFRESNNTLRLLTGFMFTLGFTLLAAK